MYVCHFISIRFASYFCLSVCHYLLMCYFSIFTISGTFLLANSSYVSAMSIQHEGPHVALFVMQIFWQQTLFLNKSWNVFFFLHFEELFLVIEFLAEIPPLPTFSTLDIPLLLAFTVSEENATFIMLFFSVYDELFCLLATFKFFSLFLSSLNTMC